MMLGPDARLVRVAGAWTATAIVLVALPALWPLWAAALATLALVASVDAVAVMRSPAVRVARQLPDRALVGHAAEVVVELENPGARAVSIELVDELPHTLTAVEPRETALALPARGRLALRHAIHPTERGDTTLGPVVLWQRSPYGLWQRRITGATGAVLRVHPDARRYLRGDALRPRKLLAELGVKRARERGEGMDFESLRDYVVGDDVRRIDWNATARRGRPVTRLFQHERNRVVVIAVDTSRLMGSLVDGRTKLDHAVDAALALAYGAVASGDRVGMLTFDDDVRGVLAPAPRRHIGSFVDLLCTARPRLVEADYAALARRLAVGRQRRALVVVLSDFVDTETTTIAEPLRVLAERHRVLFTALRDRVYGALTPSPDDDALAPYRRVVLDELLADRERMLARLRRAGIETLDLTPERITPALLNRFLAMRAVAA
jgi:uncharacterized protein (DUF58 family)